MPRRKNPYLYSQSARDIAPAVLFVAVYVYATRIVLLYVTLLAPGRGKSESSRWLTSSAHVHNWPQLPIRTDIARVRPERVTL